MWDTTLRPLVNDLSVSIAPVLAEPPGYSFDAIFESQAILDRLVGAWWFLGLFVVFAVFNTFLGEELLFRGVLLPRMQGVFGKWSWVANGVLFGFYHVHQPWGITEVSSAASSFSHIRVGASAAHGWASSSTLPNLCFSRFSSLAWCWVWHSPGLRETLRALRIGVHGGPPEENPALGDPRPTGGDRSSGELIGRPRMQLAGQRDSGRRRWAGLVTASARRRDLLG